MASKKQGKDDGPRKKRMCVVDPLCREDMRQWGKEKPRVLDKIFELLEHVLRDPFEGIGKPEPLKHLGPNTWARRITGEDRLVYVVFDDRVVFVQAKYHY